MAYCRFAPGDVYIYHHVNGFLECCACRLTKRKRYKAPHSKELEILHKKLFNRPYPKTVLMYQNFTTHSRKEMIEHIRAHKKAGHKVTSNPITRLRQEIKELGDEVK